MKLLVISYQSEFYLNKKFFSFLVQLNFNKSSLISDLNKNIKIKIKNIFTSIKRKKNY